MIFPKTTQHALTEIETITQLCYKRIDYLHINLHSSYSASRAKFFSQEGGIRSMQAIDASHSLHHFCRDLNPSLEKNAVIFLGSCKLGLLRKFGPSTKSKKIAYFNSRDPFSDIEKTNIFTCFAQQLALNMPEKTIISTRCNHEKKHVYLTSIKPLVFSYPTQGSEIKKEEIETFKYTHLQALYILNIQRKGGCQLL